ncbi:MAG: alpha/beta hydrolase [Spirochaetia bacterium]
MELKRASLPKGTISYRSAGVGPAILFLHGLGGGSKSWLYQLKMLSRRYQVLAWDTPGYGESARRSPDLETYARSAAELIEALHLDRVTLVGNSMGGLIAGRLAAIRPDLISRLVLSSTFAGKSKPQDAPLAEGYRKRIQELETLTGDEFGRARAKSMTAATTTQEAFDLVAEIASEVHKDGYADACKMLDGADNRAVLPQLKLPVLILEAEDDSIVTKEKGDELSALIPHAERATIKAGGHASYIEIPEEYNRYLVDFIERTPSDRSAAE